MTRRSRPHGEPQIVVPMTRQPSGPLGSQGVADEGPLQQLVRLKADLEQLSVMEARPWSTATVTRPVVVASLHALITPQGRAKGRPFQVQREPSESETREPATIVMGSKSST